MRGFFGRLSRLVLVPLFRAHLGWLAANPISGYLMVVETRGRESGRTRRASVMYAIDDGSVYAMAGWGATTGWYRNSLARPEVTALLPARKVEGTAEEVIDPAGRARALRLILRASGLSAFSEGVSPWIDCDEKLLASAETKPVVRIRPSSGPVRPGSFDPGGRGWLLTPGLLAALVVGWLAFRGL